DDGGFEGLRRKPIDRGEDNDCENEIRERPGGCDERALMHRLAVQGARTRLGVHMFQASGVRAARSVRIAGKTHITSKRQPANLRAGAVAVRPAQNLAAKADREGLYGDAKVARHQKMAEFMEEDHDRDDEQEGWQSEGHPAEEVR